MEAPEAIFTGSNDHTQIIKGKRTKRQRPPSPYGAAMASSTSSGGGGAGSGSGGEVGGGEGEYCSTLSPSSEVSESTEEEEDMANCLILLAQGNGPRQIEEGGRIEKFSSRKFTEMANTTTGKAGFYVYECKTCNRTFPSFQALGGHRASHKRPKAIVEEKKVPTLPSDDEFQVGQFNKSFSPPNFSLQQIANKALNSNNKSRVHECSICGSEFSSGQALGGHMRRHRTSSSTRITMSMDTNTIDDSHDVDKPRNILPLDLNLPAPEDDNRDSKFQFTSNQPRLIFPPTALVDCHY